MFHVSWREWWSYNHWQITSSQGKHWKKEEEMYCNRVIEIDLRDSRQNGLQRHDLTVDCTTFFPRLSFQSLISFCLSFPPTPESHHSFLALMLWLFVVHPTQTCEATDSLPTCRFFRDVTWTLTSLPDNRTTQTVQCTCPKNSVSYIFKHESFETEGGTAYKYLFACSPESVSKSSSSFSFFFILRARKLLFF